MHRADGSMVHLHAKSLDGIINHKDTRYSGRTTVYTHLSLI